MDLDQSLDAQQLQACLSPDDSNSLSSQPDAAPMCVAPGPAPGDGDNPLLATLPNDGAGGAGAGGAGAGGAGGGSAGDSSKVDDGLDIIGQIGTWADVAVSTAETAGAEMGTLGKAMPGIGSVISGISCVNDVVNAVETDDPEKRNMAIAKAVLDGASVIPGVGTYLGVADTIVGKGMGEAVGWDDKKEGGSIMNYGVERTMESLGILHHADSPSEKESRAAAHEVIQQEARGEPPANPINPIAPDPFAPTSPLDVPDGIPRPPGM